MNWIGSGFITIINYATPILPPVEDKYLLTEDNFYILTEDGLQIEIES